MEERNNLTQTESIVEDFVLTDEILQEIVENHFADFEEDEDEITVEEVEGLAVNIVELNDMYNEVEEKQKKLIRELDQLQMRLNKLEIMEEE